MIQHILYATDGSFAAQKAGDYAASLAVRFHSKVTVLHVYGQLPVARAEITFPNLKSLTYEKEAEELLVREAKRLHSLGVEEVETSAVLGQPVNVILGVAESIRPDLIVLGGRGSGTWQGLLLGSTSISVAHRAEIPVLIVK